MALGLVVGSLSNLQAENVGHKGDSVAVSSGHAKSLDVLDDPGWLDGLDRDQTPPGGEVTLFGEWGPAQRSRFAAINRAGVNALEVLSWNDSAIKARVPISLSPGSYMVRVYSQDPRSHESISTDPLDLDINPSAPLQPTVLKEAPPRPAQRPARAPKPSATVVVPSSLEAGRVQNRLEALRRFENVKTLPSKAVPMIVEDLADPNGSVQWAALKILQTQIPFPASGRAELDRLLEHPQNSSLERAMALLPYLSAPRFSARETTVLLSLLKDPNPASKWLAMGPLKLSFPPSQRIMSALAPYAWDSNEGIRKTAVDALGNLERSRMLNRGMRRWPGLHYSHPHRIRLASLHPLRGKRFGEEFKRRFPRPAWWNEDSSNNQAAESAEELKAILARHAGDKHARFQDGYQAIAAHPEQADLIFDGLAAMRSGEPYYPWRLEAEEFTLSQFLGKPNNAAMGPRKWGEPIAQTAIQMANDYNENWDFERTIDLVDEVFELRAEQISDAAAYQLTKLQATALYNIHRRARAGQVIERVTKRLSGDWAQDLKALRVAYVGPAADNAQGDGRRWLEQHPAPGYSPVQGKGRWPGERMPEFSSFHGEAIPRLSKLMAGQRTLLYIFRRGCEECRLKRRALAPITKKLRAAGWKILALEYLGNRERPHSDALEFPNEVFLADENINVPPALGVSEFTVFAIGPEGVIRYRGGVNEAAIRAAMKPAAPDVPIESGIQVGQRLIDFELPDDKGQVQSIAHLIKGHKAFLYPIQALNPRYKQRVLPSVAQLAPTLQKNGVLIIGIRGQEAVDGEPAKFYDHLLFDDDEVVIQRLQLTGALVVDEKGIIQQNDPSMGPLRVYESAGIPAH